jgi:hypothetical protein
VRDGRYRTIYGVSDFTVIRAASLTLHALLTAAITDSADLQLNGIPIDLRSPHEMREANIDTGVSLWLHRVWRLADLVNTPQPPPAPHQRARRGVPLELGFLVTPMHKQIETRHVLLGRVVQTLNDWSTLRGEALQDTLAGSLEELRIYLHTDLIPDLSTLWHALHMPYQLSLPYAVQCVVVDSERPPLVESVVVRREMTAGSGAAPW